MESIIDTIAPYLDDHITEYQIDSWGNVEKAYKPVDSMNGIKLLKNSLLHVHEHAIEDMETPHELISVHPADGLTYLNETIVIGYGQRPSDRMREKYEMGDFEHAKNGYVIKYDMVTGEAFAKIYDGFLDGYTHPKFPKGSFWAKFEGIGIHCVDDERADVADYYFANSNRHRMRKVFGDLYPEMPEDFPVHTRAYCLSANRFTGQPLKLKRYIYGRDKGLFNLFAEI